MKISALPLFLAAALALPAVGRAAEMPKLLSETPVPAIAENPDGYCPPPPPPAAYLPEPEPSAPEAAASDAAGEEYCPPPPPVATAEYCPPPAAAPRTVVVEELVAVPERRRVVEEECYVVNEKRVEMIDEVRTRAAVRQVPVVKTKQVSEAKIVKVASPSGRATRLARGVSRSVVPYKTTEPEEYTETYLAKVRNEYTEPVLKTRKVARTVDEVKYVTRRVRVPAE
ncbi:MAG: hypothetical protein LBU64_12990 [Planctomycetota bacterium]|jgi:hypothetical protein|nr:hypothetical protein [Planctomycetota bacterium]